MTKTEICLFSEDLSNALLAPLEEMPNCTAKSELVVTHSVMASIARFAENYPFVITIDSDLIPGAQFDPSSLVTLCEKDMLGTFFSTTDVIVRRLHEVLTDAIKQSILNGSTWVNRIGTEEDALPSATLE